MTDDYGDVVTVPEAPQSAVSDDVLKSPEARPILLAVIYFLGAIGLVALVGIIGGSIYKDLPESVVLMGSNAITGVITGLAGLLAGQAIAKAQQ